MALKFDEIDRTQMGSFILSVAKTRLGGSCLLRYI